MSVLPKLDTPNRCRPATGRSRALVLGATGGIGQAFCHALARRNCDLIISGRDTAKLAQLSDTLKKQFNIEIDLLLADLSSVSDREQICSVLQANDVRWLVNAAGVVQWGNFDEIATDQEQLLFELNVLVPISFVRAAVAAFRQKGGGTIVHVASAAAFYSVPYLAAYCASKAAIVQWLAAISEECRGQPIRIQAVCPGFVKTDIFARAGADAKRLPTWLWISSERVAETSLSALGRKHAVCVPGLRYQLMLLVSHWIPSSFHRWVAGRLFGNFSKYRFKTGSSL